MIKLVSSRMPDQEKRLGRTSFEVVKILNQTKDMKKVGDPIDLRYFVEGSVGDSFLWFQPSEREVTRDWRFLARIDQAELSYLTEAPSEKATDSDRLSYYLKFLGHSNPDIANDAIFELGNIKFSVIIAHKQTLGA